MTPGSLKLNIKVPGRDQKLEAEVKRVQRPRPRPKFWLRGFNISGWSASISCATSVVCGVLVGGHGSAVLCQLSVMC